MRLLRFGLAGLLGLGVLGAALAWRWAGADPAELLARAQADFQAGRLEEADAALSRLARLRAATPMDHMARAQVSWALGRGDEALAELVGIPDDHDLAPLAHLLAGRVEVSQNRLRDAEQHFLAARERMPQIAQVHEELAYIYNLQQRWPELDQAMSALSDLRALSFERLVHWGKARNVGWNPELDCEKLEQCVAADPDDRLSRLVLVDGLRRMNRLDEAEAALRPLPESDPEARAQRALLAIERGDASEVDRLLDGSAGDHPALARIRGQLALRSGDARSAVRDFRRALEDDPDDRSLLFGLAMALRLVGEPNEAEPYMDAVHRHDAITPLIAHAATSQAKNDPALPMKLGEACRLAGRLEEAKAWCRLAIARDPTDREAQRMAHQLENESASNHSWTR